MEEFRAASQKLGDGVGVKSLMQSTGLGMIADQVVKPEGWERLYGGLMPSLVGTAASQMTTGFIQMVLTMGIHQLNFKSEWGTNLLVSLCDTHLSCGDMLSSITDESFLWSIFTAVSLFSFPAAEASVNVFYYYTYEGSVDIDSVKDPALKASILAQINHFGQTPKQLFIKPHVKRRTDRKLPPHPLKHSTYLVSQEIRKSSSPITQIVIQNDKVMVPRTNSLLKPMTYTTYIAWGFPYRSLRFMSYDQDRLLSTHENLHGGNQNSFQQHKHFYPHQAINPEFLSSQNLFRNGEFAERKDNGKMAEGSKGEEKAGN
ncbi:BEACH domain-containing protein [Arachis hypogaea]|nr:BEACH domain-containing protein [Arachis hypogaea]